MPLLACNAILGNERRTLDEDLALTDAPARADGGQNPVGPDPEGGTTLPADDAAPPGDSGADAAPLRQPQAACLKSTSPQDAVKKVELDLSPTPVRSGDGLTVSAYFTVYGDNALTNIRLDFCTPDGAKVDPGGGFNYLGGGGAVTRRWQTKNPVGLPLGRSQAQVIADGSPSLKLVWDIDVR